MHKPLLGELRAAYWRLRQRIRRALGRELYFTADVALPTERLGTAYGGWSVLPHLLGPQSLCYCVGVGEDISFDLALIERFGAEVLAFDPTPRSIEWVKSQTLPSRFRLVELGLGARNERVRFFPPTDPTHISHTILDRPETASRAIEAELRTLATLMRDLGHTKLDLLKIDIEGAEYAVLEEILASGFVVPQLLVEFHHAFSSVGPEPTRRAVAALRKAGYKLFAISETGAELSFVHASALAGRSER